MLTTGFADAPFSKLLVIGVVANFILTTAADTQRYLHFQMWSDLLQSRQFWRIFTWQLSFNNPTEVFFAAASFYNLRVIERLWGSHKFAKFLFTILPYTLLLPPVILFALHPLIETLPIYLPSGPTPLVFALLAQFHAAVPYTFRYRFSSSAQATEEDDQGVQLTSKSTSYLLPLQLAFSRVPVSFVPALVGWFVGVLWRAELLPGSGGG